MTVDVAARRPFAVCGAGYGEDFAGVVHVGVVAGNVDVAAADVDDDDDDDDSSPSEPVPFSYKS